MFYGNRQPLNRVRQPLQEYFRERILQGGESTQDNIEQGVDRLLEDLEEELQNCAVSYITCYTRRVHGHNRRRVLSLASIIPLMFS